MSKDYKIQNKNSGPPYKDGLDEEYLPPFSEPIDTSIDLKDEIKKGSQTVYFPSYFKTGKTK